MTPVLKVAIAMPCQDTINAGTTYDLVMLVGSVVGQRPDIQLPYLQNRGTIIPQQRATLVRLALEIGATHLLWIDSDMRFPRDSLFRLLEHNQPIVAANYSTRRHPILPTAEHRDFGYLFTTPEAEGLAEVTRCGMGLMLVNADVYRAIPQPWFAIGFNPKDNEYAGEDFYFCQRASKHGFQTLIDQDLSKDVRHAGEIEWTAGHALTTRELYASRKPDPLPETAVPTTVERTLELVGNASNGHGRPKITGDAHGP